MNTKRAAGFTLIELMITVAIVGILASIAYPNYQNYLLKGRRGAAQAFLLQVAQRQQQYFLDNRSFAPDLTTLGVTTPPEVLTYYGTVNIDQGIAPPRGPPAYFTITATPQGVQAKNNEPVLTIDQTGAKTPTGTAYGAW